MAGISSHERERRQTERALVTMDREFRDPGNAVVFVGPVQRAYCEPCGRRDWGAQIRIGRGDVHRCTECLRTMAVSLAARARDAEATRARADRLTAALDALVGGTDDNARRAGSDQSDRSRARDGSG